MAANNGTTKQSDKPAQLPPDQRLNIKGEVVSKVDHYGWEIEDTPGRFRKIPKALLRVDHDYQRDHIHWSRVNRIAARFSWVLFGALIVAERADGTFWVVEGQHRKLAADKRSDLDELPCIVFKSSGRAKEAADFLGINGDRSTPQMIDRFKALLTQNDPTAVAVKEMVEADGYKISRNSGNCHVQCVGVIYQSVKQDAEAARKAWAASVEVFQGDPVKDRIYWGFWALERHLRKHGLGSLGDLRWRQLVSRLSPAKITHSIAVSVEYHGKTGYRTYAEGIVRLLNKGRRTHLIPGMYEEAAANDSAE